MTRPMPLESATRHKTREMLVAQRTQLINALRGHLAELWVIAA
jgi:transposase